MIGAGSDRRQREPGGTSIEHGGGTDQNEIKFLVEKNADGIIVVDDAGTVLFANPAAERIFGRSSSSLVGSPIGVPLVTGDTSEITIHRPGSERVEAEIRVVETTWERRPALLASLRDISQRRAFEEHLRRTAKMEAVGRLTAGVAHDFNNLLTVVLGNLEAAQRKFSAANDELARILGHAAHAGQRAAMLTERLLAFSRHKPLEPRVVDANALVSGMSDLLERTLGETIRVRTLLAGDLWPVEVDPTELEAAILNLAVNARDAMPDGGELTIETANVELDAAYAAANRDVTPGCYAMIAVADAGTGMPPDVLEQVFEPFFTTKDSGRGTGLGLSQVYGFAKQSGGHVRLYSEVGIGTTAKIYLPKLLRAGARPEPAEPKRADAVPRGAAGEAILVVEDNADVRNYAVGSLRELGYTVFAAPDAAAALEVLARESTIRLLFTDLGLPGGIDGRALAQRAQALRPDLKVLITTAYAGSALVHEGRLDPGIALLNKPFTFAALAARVRDTLDRAADGA